MHCESLESRRLFSGNLTVTDVDGFVTVTGEGEYNYLVVTQVSSDRLKLSAYNETTVNGKSYVYVDTPTEGLKILQTKRGSDRLLDVSFRSVVNLGCGVSIDATNVHGKLLARALDVYGARFELVGGTIDRDLRLIGRSAGVSGQLLNVNVGGDLKIYNDETVVDQNVGIQRGQLDGDFIYRGSRGADRLFLDQVVFNGGASVGLGDGTDTFNARNVTVSNFDLSAGGGDDYVRFLENSTVRGRLGFFPGQGRDESRLEDTRLMRGLDFDDNSGNGKIYFSRLNARSTRESVVLSGTGNDRYYVTTAYFGSVNFDPGAGDNQLNFAGTDLPRP